MFSKDRLCGTLASTENLSAPFRKERVGVEWKPPLLRMASDNQGDAERALAQHAVFFGERFQAFVQIGHR